MLRIKSHIELRNGKGMFVPEIYYEKTLKDFKDDIVNEYDLMWAHLYVDMKNLKRKMK